MLRHMSLREYQVEAGEIVLVYIIVIRFIHLSTLVANCSFSFFLGFFYFPFCACVFAQYKRRM